MKNPDMNALRHSAAHLMAAAVKNLYPGAKFDIGPATADGFYYDFDLDHRLAPEDLPAIEAEMRRLAEAKLPFERFELDRAAAETMLRDDGQTYKLERLADIPPGEVISFYRCGEFTDLCRGPHVADAGEIGAFTLLSIAGSYFRGKETNPMLQRIYGAAFATEKELRQHLAAVEEAKKRDHRKLGKELELFGFSDDVGPGLVLWYPKGALVRHLIESFWKEEHLRNGYDLLYSPHIGRAQLWETSGHLDFYRSAMYSPMDVDGQDYYVKPMNCPFHIQVYKTRPRSYRELPLRWAELGTVYRYEKSGVLHGLPRVRGFTQDDAHIICTPEQIVDEIETVLRFCLRLNAAFGFGQAEMKAYLATRPEKAVGEPERWTQALHSLEQAVKNVGMSSEVDEGGGAFYGPKIDLKIRDAIGREWQTSTIQFDFNLPERFDMTYVAEDGARHRPYMVHRALFGSLERFFGILIEHYAGAFPLWLAPVQVRVLPITERHHDYARTVFDQLRAAGLRAELDDRSQSVGAKIKDARHERIPCLLVLGDQEAADGTVSVRTRRDGQLGAMPLPALLEKIKAEIDTRA
jgi:threonyl-tRNA synthetase